MEVKGLPILIIGLARSGIASARFLHSKQAKVTITDSKPREQQEAAAAELEELGIELVLGSYPQEVGNKYRLVVTSPGVPLTIPPLQEALQAGVPVISEIELAYKYGQAPMVAITGTNGKTTTTTLIGQMFSQAGREVCVAGNIGLPLISVIEKYSPEAVVVVEVSSFQLETTDRFKPKVSLILNITPDHLDRHGTLESYTQAKAKIYANQGYGDFTILNYDDATVAAFAEESKGQVIFFSRVHNLTKGVCVQDRQVVLKDGEQVIPVIKTKDIRIPGAHNLENALAAVATGWVMGVTPAKMADALRNFPGVAHRLEQVAEVDGVTYINDSKGTNPDAAIKALEAFDRPIVLIAGGYNKGSDFTEFAQKVQARAHALVVVGQVADKIAAAAAQAGVVDIVKAETFDETVRLAAKKANPGDIVLLSPACASWDMFSNFEERGDLFKKLVSALRT
ncbi:MAG: UDP-N-acetylmuramoyl-L-alanine--D-glutamate ligase [Carboxydocellales bacterium]